MDIQYQASIPTQLIGRFPMIASHHINHKQAFRSPAPNSYIYSISQNRAPDLTILQLINQENPITRAKKYPKGIRGISPENIP